MPAVLEKNERAMTEKLTDPPVRIVAIVGEGSVSPLNNATWQEVMLHTVKLKAVDSVTPSLLFQFIDVSVWLQIRRRSASVLFIIFSTVLRKALSVKSAFETKISILFLEARCEYFLESFSHVRKALDWLSLIKVLLNKHFYFFLT